ncbi:tetraspanin, partial [Clonorchis sinensis]
GCVPKVEEFIQENLVAMGVCVFIFALIQLICMTFAICVVQALRKGEGETALKPKYIRTTTKEATVTVAQGIHGFQFIKVLTEFQFVEPLTQSIPHLASRPNTTGNSAKTCVHLLNYLHREHTNSSGAKNAKDARPPDPKPAALAQLEDVHGIDPHCETVSSKTLEIQRMWLRKTVVPIQASSEFNFKPTRRNIVFIKLLKTLQQPTTNFALHMVHHIGVVTEFPLNFNRSFPDFCDEHRGSTLSGPDLLNGRRPVTLTHSIHITIETTKTTEDLLGRILLADSLCRTALQRSSLQRVITTNLISPQNSVIRLGKRQTIIGCEAKGKIINHLVFGIGIGHLVCRLLLNGSCGCYTRSDLLRYLINRMAHTCVANMLSCRNKVGENQPQNFLVPEHTSSAEPLRWVGFRQVNRIQSSSATAFPPESMPQRRSPNLFTPVASSHPFAPKLHVCIDPSDADIFRFSVNLMSQLGPNLFSGSKTGLNVLLTVLKDNLKGPLTIHLEKYQSTLKLFQCSTVQNELKSRLVSPNAINFSDSSNVPNPPYQNANTISFKLWGRIPIENFRTLTYYAHRCDFNPCGAREKA